MGTHGFHFDPRIQASTAGVRVSPLSHGPGWQLLFVHPCQGLGRAVDHLPAGHAREHGVPVRPAHVQHALLQHLAHRHQQPRPPQAVVLRGETLGLRVKV